MGHTLTLLTFFFFALTLAACSGGNANQASTPLDEAVMCRTGSAEEPPLCREVAAQMGMERFDGPRCAVERICGPLVGVDCQAAADGPYYYVERDSGQVLAACGGACQMGDCENCPPSRWTCEAAY